MTGNMVCKRKIARLLQRVQIINHETPRAIGKAEPVAVGELTLIDNAEPALHLLTHDFPKLLFLLRGKKKFGRVHG